MAISWSLVSGPSDATVIFADASALSTTATFSVAGIYVLRLTASDGDLVTFDEVTITANPTLVVSNLQVASGKAYQVVPNGLTNGAEVYIDRSYTFSTVPVIIEGATYIQTANRDKKAREDTFLSFSVNQDVTVYVAYDVRAKSLPDWLASWTNTGEAACRARS